MEALPQTETDETTTNPFEKMGLMPQLLQAIGDLGFTKPTPIQEAAIPHVINNDHDLIGLAQTGTGKTAAFSLPVIQKLDADHKQVQALILCPTRELCLQITRDMDAFLKYYKKVNAVAVYGGDSISRQIDQIKRGAQIVVGTPGRVNDLIRRRKLKVADIDWLVLDEADEMLNMGFKEELDAILEQTPTEKQTLLFSATMPPEIKRIAGQYMHQPETINVRTKHLSAKNVRHVYYTVRHKDKYQALKRIADMTPDIYGIVFCRTRRETQEIADMLMQDHYNADSLHGDLSQAQRNQVMGRFRKKQLNMLVATDVAARGIDVNDLTHVINYKLPDNNEAYIHRSGRTGRAGKNGVSVSIIQTSEIRKIHILERKLKKTFEHLQVPSGDEICKKQLFSLIDKMENIEVNETQIAPFMDAINEKLNTMEREELIKRFVSAEFNRFLEYYKNARNLNVKLSPNFDKRDGKFDKRKRGEKRGGRKSGKKGGKTSFARLHINIGRREGLSPVKLIGLVNDTTNNRNIRIGKIEILKNYTIFDVDAAYSNDVLRAFDSAIFDGVPIEMKSIKIIEQSGNFGFNRGGGKRKKDRKRKFKNRW